MHSVNWIGVIWLSLWGCIIIGSTVMTIVGCIKDHIEASAGRKRKRRNRRKDRRALADRWWELTVG